MTDFTTHSKDPKKLPANELRTQPIAVPTRVPNIVLFALTLTFASVSIDETVLFPFVPNQVASFDVTSSDTTLGYYAGLIGSAYYVGTLISSSPWGLISDRIGRKPVLILGILSNILWSSLYGFSGTLWQAVLARFCNGLFGGLYPVGKTVVAEIPDSSNIEGVYFVVGLGWALGFLFGPAIGGFLSQPSLKYPTLFPPGSFFDRHPFALPCLVVAGIAVANLAFVLLYLPETHGRAKRDPDLVDPVDAPSKDVVTGYSSIEVLGGGGDTAVQKDTAPASPQVGSWTLSNGELVADESGRKGERAAEEDPGWYRAFFWNRETVILSVMYAMMGYTVTSFTEVFALWGLTDWEYGGLALSTTSVGLVQAAAGPLLIPYQLCLYAPLARRLGPLTTLRLALLGMALLACYPICRVFTAYGTRVAVASLFMASRGISVTTGYTTFLILIANSVRYPKYLGAVNGISQSIQMTLMAAAPAVGSSIYAWSITGRHHFPLDYRMYWLHLGALCFLMLAISYTLPSSIDRRKYVVEEKKGAST